MVIRIINHLTTGEPHLCHHQQAHKEASQADDEKEDFAAMAHVEELRIHVGDGGGQSLQAYELPSTEEQIRSCAVTLRRFNGISQAGPSGNNRMF